GVESVAAIMDLRGRGRDGGSCQGDSHATRVDVWAQTFIDPFVAMHEQGAAADAAPDRSADLGSLSGKSSGGCAIAAAPRGDTPRALCSLALGWLCLRRRRRSSVIKTVRIRGQ